MSRPINTLQDLQEYIRALQANSLHHAQDMLDVFPKVLVAALGRMDTGTLEAWERSGEVKNAAWCEIKGEPYFFAYDHDNECVCVKEKNKNGQIIDRYHDSDSFMEISRRLANLSSQVQT